MSSLRPPYYTKLPLRDNVLDNAAPLDFSLEVTLTADDLLSVKSTQPDSAALNYRTTTISKSQAPQTNSGTNGYRSPFESSWLLL